MVAAPPWKVSLYNWEMISPWECNFQTGGLAYDKIPRKW